MSTNTYIETGVPTDQKEKRDGVYGELSARITESLSGFRDTEHKEFGAFTKYVLNELNLIGSSPSFPCDINMWCRMDKLQPPFVLAVMRVLRHERAMHLGEKVLSGEVFECFIDIDGDHGLRIHGIDIERPSDVIAINNLIVSFGSVIDSCPFLNLTYRHSEEDYLGTGVSFDALNVAAQVVNFCINSYPLEILSDPCPLDKLPQ